MAQVHAGLATHGMAWFAQEQYAGKGQRGKQWNVLPGENITMSIVLQPDFIEPSSQFQLSTAIALAVFDFFSHYAGDETKIKWPNDIYWRDRKAGGILIENIIGSSKVDRTSMDKGQLASSNQQQQLTNYKWAIAGIGLNVNQTSFPPFLPNPVSLKQITGKDWDCFQLSGELQKLVLTRFEQLRNEGFPSIFQAYLSHIYKLNQWHKFKKENRVFEALVKEILPTGQLVLQHAVEEQFEFGEIEWVPVKN